MLPEKDELSWTKKQLLAKMDVAMGGRVAEEIIFGTDNVTTGASSDFKHATAIATAMVTQYAMSDAVRNCIFTFYDTYTCTYVVELIPIKIGFFMNF